MAASREVMSLKSFNGGLFLAAQTSDLSTEYTPDALNVDFGQKGGFVLRGGLQALDQDPVADGSRFICAFYKGVDAVLVQGSDGQLYLWSGSWPVAPVGELTDTTDQVRGTPFYFELGTTVYNRVYFANCWDTGALVSRYWDGTSISTLANTWNDDYLSPVGGAMPLARYNANHNGYMFVADTVEAGVRYPHRVRFSHQNFAEDWAQDDYFEVDPTDEGDPITGIVKFRDMLVIFKRNSVWGLYGSDRSNFYLERITDASGACTCGAADSNSSILYWFSTDGRLMAFNGKDTTYLSMPLQWWSDLGYIKHGGSHRVRWMDGRLWLDLEATPPSGVERGTFVWDPSVKAFTRYDLVLQDMFQWVKTGEDADPLFLFKNDPGIYRYDREYSFDTDADGTPRRIAGRFRTAWLTAGETATKKRWKRPRITTAADSDATLIIRVFHDFNVNATKRSYTQFLTAPEDATLWGAPDPLAQGIPSGPLGPGTNADGNMVWGESNWYYRDSDYYGFDRLGSAGSARSIQFEFRSDDNLGRWWLDSIAIPFRRKMVK